MYPRCHKESLRLDTLYGAFVISCLNSASLNRVGSVGNKGIPSLDNSDFCGKPHQMVKITHVNARRCLAMRAGCQNNI